MPTFSCHNEEDYNELNRAFTNATWRLNDLNEDLLNYQMGLHTLSEVVSEKEKIAAGWVLRYDNKKSIYDAVVLRKIEHEAKVSSITIQIKQLTWIASLSCGCEEDNLAKMKVIEEKLELELKDHVAQVILLEVAITDIKNEEDPFGEEVCMEANRLVLEAKQELDKPINPLNMEQYMSSRDELMPSNVNENLKNLNECISESKKSLSEGGKIIIVESCVPYWFYLIEQLLFKPSSYLINKFLNHPPAFQFTKNKILETLKKNKFKNIQYKKIKQGRFILQYGFKFPTFLTPVETIIFEAIK